jgi:ankyrin repeat protein
VNPNYPVDHHNGNTCLHLACEHGHDEVVRYNLSLESVSIIPSLSGCVVLQHYSYSYSMADR